MSKKRTELKMMNINPRKRTVVSQNLIRKSDTKGQVLDTTIPFHIPHKRIKENENNIPKPGVTKKKHANIELGILYAGSDEGRSSLRTESVPQYEPVNLNKLIEEKIMSSKEYIFIYMTYSIPRSSEYFTPYSLKEARYCEIDRNEFFTVDREGVCFFSRSDNHFTKLSVWRAEYDLYLKLIKLRTFCKYRLWKGFKIWQKTIHWRKYNDARQYLEDHLFIANPWLATAVLTFRKEYCDFVGMHFIDETTKQDYELFYFIENQMSTFEACKDRLMKFRNSTAEVIYDACNTAITKKGFQPVDEVLIFTTKKKLREISGSYVYRAQKRRFCLLLTNFLTYLDYMTVSILHEIIKRSFEKLSAILRIHDKFGPSEYQLLNTVIDKGLEAPRPSEFPQKSLLIARLVLTPGRVEINPSRDVTIKIFQQFKNLIDSTICDFERFQTDPAYHFVTE